MIEPEGDFDRDAWDRQADELRATLDAANRAVVEQHEVRAFGHDEPLRVFPARGEVLAGPPDVPVTHFLDVGYVTADGLVDVELPAEPPFARGGWLPPASVSFPYDPARDGVIIPAALVREHGDNAVQVMIERAGRDGLVERTLVPGLTVASAIERRRGRHDVVLTTETRAEYRARLAREHAAAAAAAWAARDRIRARRRRGRKK